MEQRTCNIIMCCKGHCKLAGENAPPLEAIAVYMSAECACPKEDYTGKLMETILREALFGYMAGADKPGYELRQLLQQYATHDPDLSERIYTLFQLARVRDDNGYINGLRMNCSGKVRLILEPPETVCPVFWMKRRSSTILVLAPARFLETALQSGIR